MWEAVPQVGCSCSPSGPMLKVRCQTISTLDEKGRLALPSALRHACEAARISALVLTPRQGAIWGWDPDTFESRVEEPLRRADPFAQDVESFTHAYLAPAQDVDIDGQGRIRIPPLLRDFARLEKEVVVNSLLDRIEIWDRATWEDHFRRSVERARTLPGMPGVGGS